MNKRLFYFILVSNLFFAKMFMYLVLGLEYYYSSNCCFFSFSPWVFKCGGENLKKAFKVYFFLQEKKNKSWNY